MGDHADSQLSNSSTGYRAILYVVADLGIVIVGCTTLAATLLEAAPTYGTAGYLLPAILAILAIGVATVAWMAFGGTKALVALFGVATLVLQISFWARPIGETGLDPQNGLKFATWALFLFVGFRHRALIMRSLRDRALAILLSYSLFCLVSAAWSPVPTYTFASAVGNFAWLALAITLAARVDDEVVLKTLAYVLVIECLIALVTAWVIPDMAWLEPSEGETVRRLQGLAGHPNVLAQHAALLTITVLGMRDAKMVRARWMFPVLALAFGILYLTNSRTAMMAVGASAAVAYLRKKPRLVGRGLSFIAAGVAMFAILKASGLVPDASEILSSLSRSGDASEITTITGRSELWQIAWEHFKERPLLGWGFNGTEQLMTDSVSHTFEGGAVNAHNVVMQGLMSLGVLGFTPVVLIFYFFISRMFTSPDGFRDRLAVFVIVLGFGEADFLAVPVITSLLMFWSLARDAFRCQPALLGPFFVPSRASNHYAGSVVGPDTLNASYLEREDSYPPYGTGAGS